MFVGIRDATKQLPFGIILVDYVMTLLPQDGVGR